MNFFRIYGHKLEELGIYGENKEIKNYLKFCQNIRKFFIHEVLSLITEDNELLPKSEEIEENLVICSNKLNKMTILSNRLSHTMKILMVKLCELTAKELKKYFECISRFENLKELRLQFGSLQITEPIDYL